MSQETCVACKGNNLHKGKMGSFNYAGFTLEGGKHIPMTQIEGTACLDCGALILSIEPKRLAESINAESK